VADIEVIRTYPSLENLAEEWSHLVETSPKRDVIHSHPWYSCWARHFAREADLCIPVVREAGTLVAALPLMRTTFSKGGLKVRIARSMTNRYSPYFDFISTAPGTRHLPAVLDQAFRTSRTHMMLLDRVPASSAILEGIDEACHERGYRYLVRGADGNRFIHLRGTFDEYFNTLKSKFRKNLRAAERKAGERGPLALLKPRSQEELMQFLERGFNLEARSWKGEAGTAINQSEARKAFFFDLARGFHDRGWLRVWILTSAGEDIAFYLCVEDFDAIHAVIIAASPEHRGIGPGLLLTWKALEEVFAELDSGVWNFGGGSDRWKKDFSGTGEEDQREEYFKVIIFRDSVRGRLLRSLAAAYQKRERHDRR
jgi:CelD/BcsL family acetyltransferase involved in cellulose biosynthesis